jgi:hypothetical protein
MFDHVLCSNFAKRQAAAFAPLTFNLNLKFEVLFARTVFYNS